MERDSLTIWRIALLRENQACGMGRFPLREHALNMQYLALIREQISAPTNHLSLSKIALESWRSSIIGWVWRSFGKLAQMISLRTRDRKSTRLNSSHANISY